MNDVPQGELQQQGLRLIPLIHFQSLATTLKGALGWMTSGRHKCNRWMAHWKWPGSWFITWRRVV